MRAPSTSRKYMDLPQWQTRLGGQIASETMKCFAIFYQHCIIWFETQPWKNYRLKPLQTALGQIETSFPSSSHKISRDNNTTNYLVAFVRCVGALPSWQCTDTKSEGHTVIFRILELRVVCSCSLLTTPGTNLLTPTYNDGARTFRVALLFFRKCEKLSIWLVPSKLEPFFDMSYRNCPKNRKLSS